MMTEQELLEKALSTAERGAFLLKRLRDGTERYCSDRLYDAWADLHDAAEFTEDLQRKQERIERTNKLPEVPR